MWADRIKGVLWTLAGVLAGMALLSLPTVLSVIADALLRMSGVLYLLSDFLYRAAVL